MTIGTPPNFYSLKVNWISISFNEAGGTNYCCFNIIQFYLRHHLGSKWKHFNSCITFFLINATFPWLLKMVLYQETSINTFTILAILTTIKRKKIHRDQYSSDNAVCYLFCQPFYVVMLFFPLVTTYLRIKSVQIHFLSGTSIPNLEEFSSPCWVIASATTTGFQGRLLATHTFPLWSSALGGGSANTVPQAVIGSTNCESQSHLTSCEQPTWGAVKDRAGKSCRDRGCRSIQRRCKHPRPLCQPKEKTPCIFELSNKVSRNGKT